jgi:hypothetical protein
LVIEPAEATSSVVSCHVCDRVVSAWIVSTMRLMLFFDGRYPRYAFPVLAECKQKTLATGAGL